MLLAALRDLQWRRRRFVIAVLGAGLVFAMSLVGSGLSQAFRNEIDRTIALTRADRWLVPSAAVAGPFTDRRPFPADGADAYAAVPGVDDAAALVFAGTVVDIGHQLDVNLFGVVPGAVGSPQPAEGMALSGPGEVVADEGIGVETGATLTISGIDFDVVGTTDGATMFGGAPNVYVVITDAETLVFAGQPLATAVVLQGEPAPGAFPPEVRMLTNAQTKADALRVLDTAVSTIDLVRVLLWVVAVTIMGSILYLSAIERTRDIAVFKATGTSNGAVAAGLALQSVVLAATASVIAVVLARILAPRFPLPAEIPTSAYVAMPLIALVVALLASVAAMRRAVGVQPALAFGA